MNQDLRKCFNYLYSIFLGRNYEYVVIVILIFLIPQIVKAFSCVQEKSTDASVKLIRTLSTLMRNVKFNQFIEVINGNYTTSIFYFQIKKKLQGLWCLLHVPIRFKSLTLFSMCLAFISWCHCWYTLHFTNHFLNKLII